MTTTTAVLAASLLLATRAAAQSEPALPAPAPTAWSVGVNYLGGQVDYDFGRGHRLEARFLTGKSSSSQGRVSSTAAGVRYARRFRMDATYHPYLGVELAYVSARAAASSYRVSGVAPGAFVGLERRLSSRLSAGFDAGPYLFLLKESTTHAGRTTFDAVANVYLLLRVL